MVGVKLQDLNKSFGRVKAVDGVSLGVGKGELFFLLGPSGCGKTTALRMIAGFCAPDSGEIYFDAKPMNTVPAHMRNTGMVFQNYALWPHMSVEKNVSYGLEVRKVTAAERTERVRKALETVRMLEYAGRKPAQLSGGQQQRVALARALIIEPDLLLFDEPLSNLDAKLRLEMREEIKRIHGETGITSIYVTHDQKEALSMADRIAVMNAGRIAQVGTPRELYEKPADRFVAGFIGETNFIEGRITEIRPDGIAVETGMGMLISRMSSGAREWSRGGQVVCSIRPESIEVRSEKDAGTVNRLEASVAHFTYLGDNEQYLLDAGGTVLKAVSHNPFGKVRQKGSKAWISIEPENVILLEQ